MTTEKTGMIAGAHPTAPGGMSEAALAVELVEMHGWTMREAKALKWPEKIDAVCQARRDAEREAADLGVTVAHVMGETDSVFVQVETLGDDDGDADDMFALLDDDDDLTDDPDLDDDDDSDFIVAGTVTVSEPDPEPVCGCGLTESEHDHADPPHAFVDQSIYLDDEGNEVPPVLGATPSTEPLRTTLNGRVIDLPTPPAKADTTDFDPDELMAEVEAAQAEHAAAALFIGMPTTRDYIFDGHAGAGPSGAERWMRCTMSLSASRKFLETLSPNQAAAFAQSGTAARQGTTAHAVGEIRVREALGEVDSAEVEATLLELAVMPDEEGESYDAEMEEHVSEYVDLARTYINAGHEVRVEQRVLAAVPLTQSGLAEDDVHIISGSADLVVLPTKETPVLTVGDLKYGEGLDVDVYENPQVRIYALGVLTDLADPDTGVLPDLDHVEYIICQPRLGGIKVWSESVDDLLAWRDDVLSPALTAALGGEKAGATFTPGDKQCQWCPARGGCAALAEQRVESAAELFESLNEAEFDGVALDPLALDDARLAALLTQVTALVDLRDDLKAEAQRRMHRGVALPGYKMVSYTPPRKWAEGAQDQIAAGIKGLPAKSRALLFKEPALLTPKQALTVLGEQAPLIEGLIESPDKRPVIAPATDRRHEWRGLPPEVMFPETPTGDES